MKEINNETVQKIKMCIKTFINLYGTRPTVQDMVRWLGQASEKSVQDYFATMVIA